MDGVLESPRTRTRWTHFQNPTRILTGLGALQAPARLKSYETAPRYRAERVVEALGNVYECHYPNKVPTSVSTHGNTMEEYPFGV